ncbi:MAG: CotH kinase family protein [Clostridia bacterium]|nr:CotH kinase family protein [Clostridia bacterium]
MKKKILILLFTAIAAGALFLGLTACGGHIHTFSEEWSFDSYYHWHDSTCEHGGEVDGKGEHSWNSGEIIVEATCNAAGVIKYTCTDCGKAKEESTKEYSKHSWNQGIISTSPTCITSGIITYTCTECNEIKKEMIDANAENHLYGNYENDENYHWRTCRLCGSVFKEEHGFNGASSEGDVDDIFECLCGVQKTVGELFAYKVIFECGEGVSVLIYDTKNYENGIVSDVAYSRDSDTGELIKNGDGQVNFEIVVGLGYKLTGVTATPSGNFKNLKYPDEVGRDNSYRLTKITGEVIISIETEMDFLNLPVMVINTNDYAPILDKENYVTCSVSVLNAEDEYCFESIGAGIRGRGNTTWALDKKPYKLKFDSKINLFGNGAAKKWTLIANYADPSLLRNFFAYSIAGENGILNNTEYTTTVQNVELYLNGEYCGVYLLCEQNEVGSTRVNIDESLKNEDGSLKVNTGYLLESDSAYIPNEGIEGLDFFKVNGECYAIKSPDTENEIYLAHKEEFIAFIQNIVQIAVDNLNNLTNSAENYARICELLDISSFVDGYLIDELTNIADGCFSSFYLYYDNLDGKIHRGPIWDYDASCGNAAYMDEIGNNNPEFLRASLIFWYNKLLKFDGFKQAVKERLIQISASNAFINFLDYKVNEIIACSASFNRNFEKWDGVLGQRNLTHWNTETIISMTTWREQLDYLIDWLKASYNNLIAVYCSQDEI